MAKTKRSTALFDLLSDPGEPAMETLKVPGWWSKNEESSRIGEHTEVSDFDDGEVAPEREYHDQGTEAGRAFVQVDGDRIRVSFTSFTAAMTFFGLLVAGLGAFAGGRHLGEKAGLAEGYQAGRDSFVDDAMSEIELARSQPPDSRLVESLLVDGGAAELLGNRVGTAADPWVRDYTYIVVQEFSAGHEEDAPAAQDFLRQHGIETASVKMESGWTRLITKQGYNRSDPTHRRMADELLEKVHSVGGKYYQSGGGYRLEGYFKTLKSESW